MSTFAGGAVATPDIEPVPVGTTTKIGAAGAAVLALAAGVAAVVNGDLSTETITALVGAVVTLVTVLAGRYAQATAIAGATVTGASAQAVQAMQTVQSAAAAAPPQPPFAGGLTVVDAPDEEEDDDLPPSIAELMPTDPKTLPPDLGGATPDDDVVAGRIGGRS
ncbi:MAG TPA: hypothetical protein VI318_02200 [Baekduia sp.]